MTHGSSRKLARAEAVRAAARASSLLEAGRVAEAIGRLLEAVRLVPDDAALQNELGSAFLRGGRLPDAVAALRKSIALAPSADAYSNLGIAMQGGGDDDGAIASFREAASLSPELTVAQARLGDLLFDKGERTEAATAYAAAATSAPTTSLGRVCRAMALYAEARLPEAEEELRRLISDDPSNIVPYSLLGRSLQERGCFDEAAQAFEKAIEVAPWRSDAYYGLASSKRFTEADRSWIAKVESRLEAKEWEQLYPRALADQHRMRLHFAIGKALDDLGEHAEAMRHFEAGNVTRCQLRPFRPREFEQRVEHMIERFTPSFLAEHAAMGDPDPTPVLIVGMPRSGTTLLERILSSHPRVAGRGELGFWSARGPTWADAKPEALALGAKRLQGDYLKLLRKGCASDALRATDKLPFNFLWLGLVHLLFPNARLFHTRRHPIDTCLSLYTTLVGPLGFAASFQDLATCYRLYLRMMEHWRSTLPKDRLLEVDYEALVAHPEEQVRHVIAFSGLDWDPACLRPESNRAAVPTANMWQSRQPIHVGSVGRWKKYEPWIGELAALLG
jgi:tetratricopeptide (TPR) repeat protein